MKSTLVLIIFLLGCADDPAPVTINNTCTREADTTNSQQCGNGDNNYTQDTDGGTPAAQPEEIYFCFTFGGYSGHETPCMTSIDCPMSQTPCGTVSCVDGMCRVSYAKRGADLCGDEGFTCGPLGSCCGWSEPPT